MLLGWTSSHINYLSFWYSPLVRVSCLIKLILNTSYRLFQWMQVRCTCLIWMLCQTSWNMQGYIGILIIYRHYMFIFLTSGRTELSLFLLGCWVCKLQDILEGRCELCRCCKWRFTRLVGLLIDTEVWRFLWVVENCHATGTAAYLVKCFEG